MRSVTALALVVAGVTGLATLGASAANGKATVTITVSGTQTYGGSPTYTTTSSASDGSSAYAISGTLICTTSATVASAVGSYPITSCSGLTVGPANNYVTSPTYVLGSVTVTKAPLTVTGPSPSKVYGAAVPALPPTITGFVNGQNSSVITPLPTCSTTATAGSNVGSYPVTCSGGTATNYSLTFVAGTVTVAKANLTVTASSGSMTYGGTLPTISPSYSGFVNNDHPNAVNPMPTCSTTATAFSPVGGYPSSCSGGSASNYTLAYVGGTVTVGTATLIVTAPSPSKPYGSALPALTPAYSGFVNGQTASNLTSPATCTTAATAASNAGTYAVTCSGAAIPNYTISNVAGTLTVTKVTVTVSTPSTSVTFGGAIPTLTPVYAGFVNSETVSALTALASCTTTASSSSDVGNYPITCGGAAAANYTFSYPNATAVTITAASLQLSVSGTQLYGDSPSYNQSGSVPSGVSVDGILNCSTTGLSAASSVGDSQISSCTGLSLSAPRLSTITWRWRLATCTCRQPPSR